MMHEKMKKMLEKKGKRKLGDHEKAAKMSVLKELKDAMAEEMGGGLKDALAAKKVSVMAGSKEDLKKGLDIAKKAVGSMPDGMESSEEESPMHEAAESAEDERAESEEGMESEGSDVDTEIAALEAKLAKLKAKKEMSEEEEEESEEMEA